MTRRTFLQALGAVIAAPVVAKVLAVLPDPSTTVCKRFQQGTLFVSDEICEDAQIDLLQAMQKDMILSMDRAITEAVFNGTKV